MSTPTSPTSPTRQATGWRGTTDAWLLGLVLAGWLLMNVRWLWYYRNGHLLDIDEAGYFGMALGDYYAAGRDGLTGWLRAASATGIQAPLVPAFTSLLMLVAGPHLPVAFAVALLAGLATIVFTYATARRIGGCWLAWVCLALTASAPGLISEARNYHFAAAATAVTAATGYVLVRSPGLTSRAAAVAFGALLGLMPLTRTMTLAFVPMLAAAAVAQALAGPHRRRSLANCALALAVATVVVGSWLAFNGGLVLRYLIGYGYGAQSTEYGSESGLLNPAAWLVRLQIWLYEDHLPHVAILLAGLGAALVAMLRVRRQTGTRAFATTTVAALRSPLFPLVTLALGGFAALLSTSNTGLQFALPLLPATVIIAGWGLSRAPAELRAVTPLAVASVVLLAVVPMIDRRTPMAGVSTVRVPVVGDVAVTDGRGTTEIYLGGTVGPAHAQEWSELSSWAAESVLAETRSPVVAFGFRDRLFNVNTVQLAVLRDVRYGVYMAQIDPFWIGDTYADYRRWLTAPNGGLNGDADRACYLFTVNGAINEFLPSVDQDAMVDAAIDADFISIAERRLPNETATVTLWQRHQSGC